MVKSKFQILTPKMNVFNIITIHFLIFEETYKGFFANITYLQGSEVIEM
jgi:hypothetical protein